MIKAIITLILVSIYKIICNPISENELNILINSYQNNVEKKYAEADEFVNNGTVSRFNIPFRFKLYALKLDKYKMERDIEKLKNPKTNDYKYFEDYYKNEKIFLKGFRHLLNIKNGTKNFYLKTIRMIKIIFIVIIVIIFLGGIVALLIMLYISKSKYKDYSALVEKDKKDKKNEYQVVKIFNKFLGLNKKIK